MRLPQVLWLSPKPSVTHWRHVCAEAWPKLEICTAHKPFDTWVTGSVFVHQRWRRKTTEKKFAHRKLIILPLKCVCIRFGFVLITFEWYVSSYFCCCMSCLKNIWKMGASQWAEPKQHELYSEFLAQFCDFFLGHLCIWVVLIYQVLFAHLVAKLFEAWRWYKILHWNFDASKVRA